MIEWTRDQDAFTILSLKNFTTKVLPQYFKHSNFNSFIRQLNMYRFTKVRQDGCNGDTEHVYQNDLFHRDNHSQLKSIKRKETAIKTQLVPFSDSEEGSETEMPLKKKLLEMKEKQGKLEEICCTLLSQNQVLIKQNHDLAHKYKNESKKKDRIMKQVFRIVGASITEFWA